MTWADLLGNPDNVAFVLVFSLLVLFSWVWLRRKRPDRHDSNLPSLDDGWSFFTVPVLTVTAIILIITMGKRVMLLRADRAELRVATEFKLPHGKPRTFPNVVLIVSDALRAQNMSLNGYRRKTTPFLEQFADSSVVIANVLQ
jgi:Sulfatase